MLGLRVVAAAGGSPSDHIREKKQGYIKAYLPVVTRLTLVCDWYGQFTGFVGNHEWLVLHIALAFFLRLAQCTPHT